MGQGLNARDPRACRLLPANMGMLRRAQPAAPYETPKHQSTPALKTAGKHDPRENHKPGHRAARPPWRRTQGPGVRAHNPRTCYISGQGVEVH